MLKDTMVHAKSLWELCKGRLVVAVAAQTEIRVLQNRCSSHLPDLSLRCLAAVAVAIPVPLCSLLQPAIMVVLLTVTLLLPVQTADLHQSLILGAEKFNFLFAMEKPGVNPRN